MRVFLYLQKEPIMSNYENPEKVAEWLLKFDTKIDPKFPNQIEVHYTPPYKPKIFLTYVTNGNKTDAFNVVSSMVADAAIYWRNRYNIDQFVVDLDLDGSDFKISALLDVWNEAKSASEYFISQDGYPLYSDEIQIVADTLKHDTNAVKAHYDKLSIERAEAFAKENPPLPDGFVTLESLKTDLDTGLVGDQISDYVCSDIYDDLMGLAQGNVDIYTNNLISWVNDNFCMASEYINQVVEEHTYAGNNPFLDILQAAQCEFYYDDLKNHLDDVMTFYTLDRLIEAGIYAVHEDIDPLDLIGVDLTDDIEAGVNNFNDKLHNLLESAFGENQNIDENTAYDMADECVGGNFDFVNPYVLTVRTAKLINEMGYDKAFAQDWSYLLEDWSDEI